MSTINANTPVSSGFFDTIAMGGDSLDSFQDVLNAININIANFQTPGYKKLVAKYTSNISGGVATTFQNDFSQGSISTGGPLTAAIIGNGLFVTDEFSNIGNKNLYTRNGEFELSTLNDNEQYLTDAQGRAVYGYPIVDGVISDSLEPIQVSDQDIGIDDIGNVVSGFNAREQAIELEEDVIPETTPLYRLAIATFQNQEALTVREGTSFEENIRSGSADIQIGNLADNGSGTITGGVIEGSNVVITDLNVESILLQRHFNAVLNVNISNVSKLVSDTIRTIL